MFRPLSLFVGLRYVRSRHGSGFSSFFSASSTIGIGLGVMVLIVVFSAMNGFERELTLRLLSIIPHGEVISVEQPIDNWPAQVQQVTARPNVIAAAPVIKMTGMMQKGNQLKAVEIRGVDPELETQVSSIKDYIIAGSWDQLSDHTQQVKQVKQVKQAQRSTSANGVVLGAGIAKKLNVSVGDGVQILLPQPKKPLKKIAFLAPIKRNLVVVGIFKFGGTVDDSLAYISLDQAAEVMGYRAQQVQGIRLKVEDVFSAPQIARDVGYSFNHYVYIFDWTRSQGHLYNDIQLVRMVMFLVMFLVIAVASFNIVSTLIMAVNDKKGDIAILKTMGASTPMIMGTFMIQGVVNGILGCLVGALLGIYISLNLTEMVAFAESLFGTTFLSADVYFIDFLPTALDLADVYRTVLTALLMSLLATIYPAWRATKVEPAQVLGQT
jgi:lipoprotein-releasing system permease protein